MSIKENQSANIVPRWRTVAHKSTTPHYHRDKRGFLVACYHNCAALLTNWQFWLGLTLGFPLEHFIWEKVWPFYLITHSIGLN